VVYSKCRGVIRIVGSIEDPSVIRVILEHLARQVQTIYMRGISRAIEQEFRASVSADVF